MKSQYGLGCSFSFTMPLEPLFKNENISFIEIKDRPENTQKFESENIILTFEVNSLSTKMNGLHNISGKPIETTFQDFIDTNLKILIVDDQVFNIVILQEILDDMSEYRIKHLSAYNGLEAVEKVEKEADFDIIFMDYNMP